MPFPLLLLPAAGWLASKAIGTLFKDDDLSWHANIQQFRVGCAGLGLVLQVRFSGSGARSLDGGTLLARPRLGSVYITSQHDDFADKDGDIVSGNRLLMDGPEAVGSVYIPFCAFPDAAATITMEFVPIRGDGSHYPAQSFDGVELVAEQFDRRNAIAAVCDGAFGAIRQAGEVRPDHVRTAKEAIVAAWSLDSHGVRELRRYLRRATSTRLDADWYHSQRIAVDIRDELTGDDRVLILRILYDIAGAAGGVAEPADRLLHEIAAGLELDEDAIAGIRGKWKVDVHYSVLDLSPGATLAEIRNAFRRIAKLCHPDVVRHLDAAARALAAERFRAAKLAHDALIGQAPTG